MSLILTGEVKSIKKETFPSEGGEKTVYDVLVDIGNPYPELLRFNKEPEFDVGDEVDFNVRGSAYSRNEKRYLRVCYYPQDKK